jgi:molecular chaperone GrpE (heat shock protein)
MVGGLEGEVSLDRGEILHRFEVWLDSVLAAEEPPQGLSAELLSSLGAEGKPISNGRCDFYSMWAAVTALTQEVRLQGRSFKQLSESLAPVAILAPQLPELHREAQESARREVLDVFLDLLDRLTRGLDQVRASQQRMDDSLRSSWTVRLLARHHTFRQAFENVTALQEGYQMSMERLKDALAQFDVREIACEGQRFDPKSMHAVEVEETDQEAEGTVLEVYRAGFEWKGQVHRPAQVKVARRPTAIPAEGDENDE